MVIVFCKICIIYANFSLNDANKQTYHKMYQGNSMKCNIIGAGRLGKNIGLALTGIHAISSLSICNRTLDSAFNACQDIGFGLAVPGLKELPAADITWLCCNDDAIPMLVEALASQANLKPGSFVIHSSGVLNSSLLAPLQEKGCAIASFHPLKAFKSDYLDSGAFNQVDCTVEGDVNVCDWLQQTFSRLGAYVSAIAPEHKAMYHAAACIASNYLITLAACSEELLLKAGLQAQQSRRMLLNLMQGNITNMQQSERIADALTGPLGRGDLNTLALHLKAMEQTSMHHLYKAAGLATLPLTQLSAAQQDEVKNLLEH